MKVSDCRLGFVGFGHMAQIIFQAIDHSRLVPRSQITFLRRDSQKMKDNEKIFHITSSSLKNLVEQSDLIILGVRPQQLEQVLREMQKLSIDPSKKIISMVVGLPISFYRKFFKNPLLRIMPNIASQVGMGMTIFSFDKNSSPEFRSISSLLFSCMGEVLEVQEEMMDICSAIAGSGPGFFFRLMDAIAKEGVAKGLAYPEALKMTAQTFIGAGTLVLKRGDANSLLDQIATPNGTTEAGLKKMKELHLAEQFQNVLKASEQRSKEISKELQAFS